MIPSTQAVDSARIPAASDEQWSLGGDFESFFNPLESRKLRTALIDLQSLECRASWSIANRVVVAEDRSECGWHTESPSFPKILERLSKAPIGDVLVRQLGLQRCLYVWRSEPKLMVAAEVSTVGSLPASHVEPALVKEVCNIAMSTGGNAALPREVASAAPSSGDARSPSARRSWVRAGWACAACLVACAVLAGWLFAKTDLEMLRIRALMDTAMLRNLSLALAKADYGEVQETLSAYSDSGYFDQAAVSNAKYRVIAIAGDWPNVRIGEPVPGQIARATETLDLRLGSESFGQLMVPQSRTNPPALMKSGLRALRTASAWVSALALLASLVLSVVLARMSVSEEKR
ncbi:MAG: hypothetical protein JO133_14660 [Burkholderiaceae bacterium]|nr:hypothetical protein [Burkholderiaceae bacterium]